MVRACRPPAREPIELLAGAPLDNGNVDPRQRQLARQHQPRRTSSGDHHRMSVWVMAILLSDTSTTTHAWRSSHVRSLWLLAKSAMVWLGTPIAQVLCRRAQRRSHCSASKS